MIKPELVTENGKYAIEDCGLEGSPDLFLLIHKEKIGRGRLVSVSYTANALEIQKSPNRIDDLTTSEALDILQELIKIYPQLATARIGIVTEEDRMLRNKYL